MNEGFLGSLAPRSADIVLLLELTMGMALLIGAWLARKQRYHQHAWCQSTVVLLNLAVVVTMMVPSFRDQVLPRIPAKIGRSFYALSTAHAVVGTLAELLGLFILVSAGTRLLPQQLRIKAYK
ncbi:MAG TPA: hypothetical protein VFO34_13230, partial [Candidatus Acidoferrales bacterium]|nr:hypothetical protein [Candidatus Acidoferrales bacterium]